MDRSFALAARNALSKQEIQNKSKTIVQLLQPYLHGVVGIYLPYGSEVNITAVRKFKHVDWVIPIAYEDGSMIFSYLDEHTKLKRSTLGILEPIHAVEVDKNHIDVLIIPMVAFDLHNNRLGHGKGYYDRYLKGYQGLKIGVAFACQQIAEIHPLPHDVAMDMIITEHAVIKGSNHVLQNHNEKDDRD